MTNQYRPVTNQPITFSSISSITESTDIRRPDEGQNRDSNYYFAHAFAVAITPVPSGVVVGLGTFATSCIALNCCNAPHIATAIVPATVGGAVIGAGFATVMTGGLIVNSLTNTGRCPDIQGDAILISGAATSCLLSPVGTIVASQMLQWGLSPAMAAMASIGNIVTTSCLVACYRDDLMNMRFSSQNPGAALNNDLEIGAQAEAVRHEPIRAANDLVIDHLLPVRFLVAIARASVNNNVEIEL